MDIPLNVAGGLTIVFLVAFGIFIYPWLLRRRGGALVVGVLTAMLAGLYYLFDDPTGVETSTSGALALVWAFLPLVTGLVVKHAQDKDISH